MSSDPIEVPGSDFDVMRDVYMTKAQREAFDRIRAAALAPLSAPKPEGEVVVTRDESGTIVAVTRQDVEGRILSVIAEAAPKPESAEAVAWVTADTVDGQAVNGKPRRIWWENNEGVGMPIYAAPPRPEASAPVGVKLPDVPFAVFDEFGVGADDRIMDYGRACAAAAIAQQPAVFRNEGNSEARHVAHHADACTACGGSGHKSDQQPAACHKCGGTGEADSGGIMPWGAPATIQCDCQQSAAVDGATRRDAERYRWLRDGGLGYLPYDDHGCGPEYPHHEELDAAIDRILAGQQQGGPQE